MSTTIDQKTKFGWPVVLAILALLLVCSCAAPMPALLARDLAELEPRCAAGEVRACEAAGRVRATARIMEILR